MSELAGELWLAAAAALNALDACRSEPGTDSLAAAQCVTARAVADLAPEALATEIEQYCSYKAQLNQRPASVAGCFVESWGGISGRALGLRETVERFTACSFPDLIRLRELHVRRTEVHLEQIIALDALLGEVAARHRDLAYHDTLKPEWAWEQYVQAVAWLEEAHERARDFSDTLAADSPPVKVGTLIAISTARQFFSWCHNRHPERAEEWQETFAAYAEGAPASIPTWINDVPTASDPQPIDVRGAARRTFEAMVRAHETPETTAQQDVDRATQVPDSSGFTAEQCGNLQYDVNMQRASYEKELARMARLTGSAWAGCRGDFVRGAASSIGGDPDPASVASAIGLGEAERRAQEYRKKPQVSEATFCLFCRY